MNKILSLLVFFFFFFFIRIVNAAPTKRETYIVHMDLASMPMPFSSHHAWYKSILASVLDDNGESPRSKHQPNLIYSYTSAINGFKAILSPSELEIIKKSPSFLSATKDTKMELATTRSSDFLGLTSISGAWPKTKFGQDVIIGVVDTGIWPESHSFNDDGLGDIPARWKGGCYGGVGFNDTLCNKKLIGARFFNKGIKALFPNITFVDSARDDNGHGTHVSSTAAGNFVEGASFFGYASGTAKGMAPGSRLAMYKLGYTRDGLSASDIVAAIDAAIEDKIDVLSISLASASTLYDDPVAIATFAAMERGIFISSAAGNLGPSLKTITGGAPWHLTVAAGTIDRTFSGTITLGNGAYLSGVAFYPLQEIPMNLPMFLWKSCEREEPLPIFGQKIVVCVSSEARSFPSIDGLVGAVVIWNATGASYMEHLPGSFPTVFVNYRIGKVILDYINDNREPTATLWFKETIHGTKPAPEVSDLSSRGPSQACPFIVKPDVLAPGYNILASWHERKPINLYASGQVISKFNIISGTSMASPHVAGVAALLRGAHSDWSPASIRSAIMTTANPFNNLQLPIQETESKRIATPLAIGSGHIIPNKALHPGLVYDANADDYVNFLCAMNLTSKQIHAITRSRQTCTTPDLDLNYPSFMAYFKCQGTKSLRFSRTLTNVGEENSTYYAEVAQMEHFKLSVEPEKLIFKKKLEKHRYELKVSGLCLEEGTIRYGSITWLKVQGKSCSVRSPIVVAGLTP